MLQTDIEIHDTLLRGFRKMRFATLLLLFIALKAQYAAGTTQYTEDDTIIVASSVEPCHLIGDPDLYGAGMRWAFYAEFAVCLFGIFFGFYDELRVLRLGFNVLFAALIIALIRNVYQGSFAIFEWYIVTGLMFVSGAGTLALPPIPDDDDGVWEDERGSAPPPTMSGARGDAATQYTKNADGEGNGVGAREPDGNEEMRHSVATEATHVKTHAKELVKAGDRPRLSGPLSLGTSHLLYAIFLLIQPWIYFANAESGHKQGCPVPFVFFGTFDMYNPHWQRWLKAFSILAALRAPLYLYSGIGSIVLGAYHYRCRALALRNLDDRADREVERARKDATRLRTLLQKEEAKKAVDSTASREGNVEHGDQSGAIENAGEEIEQAIQEKEKLEALKHETEAKINVHRRKRLKLWRDQILSALWFAISGALPIYFIEQTLRINDIQVGEGLNAVSSSGQLINLLVASFSILGFFWEAIKTSVEARARRDELKGAHGNILVMAYYLIPVAETKINAGKEKLRKAYEQRTKSYAATADFWFGPRHATTETRSAGGSSSWWIPGSLSLFSRDRTDVRAQAGENNV